MKGTECRVAELVASEAFGSCEMGFGVAAELGEKHPGGLSCTKKRFVENGEERRGESPSSTGLHLFAVLSPQTCQTDTLSTCRVGCFNYTPAWAIPTCYKGKVEWGL